MTDRIELQRRARHGQQPVRSDEPPTSLADYKRRKDLEAYEARRAAIRESRAAFDRQRKHDDGAPRWLLTYLAILAVVVVVAIARSCSAP